MTAELYPLPAAQVLRDLFSFVKDVLLQPADKVAHIDMGFLLPMPGAFNLVNQVFDRFFKIQELSVGVSRHNP
jgi:hypothetical protein